MKIWLDADATPTPVKEIVFRAVHRVKIPVILVANRPLSLPRSPLIRLIQVNQALDAADDYLVQTASPEDLVITADIPLAARLVEKNIAVLNPRGEMYSTQNIHERLALRDFKENLRSTGIAVGGPSPYHHRDKQNFANSLDRWLAQRLPPL